MRRKIRMRRMGLSTLWTPERHEPGRRFWLHPLGTLQSEGAKLLAS
jgi:hypothetical protein